MAQACWSDRGTEVRVVVTGSQACRVARRLVTAELAARNRACGFRWAGSELSRVHRAAGTPVPISARLAELVAAALTAAELTDGDVDPTVGAALLRLSRTGRDAWLPVCGSSLRPTPQSDGWRRVMLRDGLLTVPVTVLLDLTATARAVTARRCADLLAARTGGGVLVALGGCVATAGPPPPDGWRVPFGGATLVLAGGAVARTRTTGRGPARPIVDPRTGLPPAPVWREVTVAAADPVTAKALSLAALVRGPDAGAWLAGLDTPARLVAVDGTVETITAGTRAELTAVSGG
ncbi:FAD:protein FMN transferase [Micromonospora sp. NBC_01699]|uniref:FAD:protein FMN transferase n=1 Tax=Micromonospora sp. NBC_01699 TaxID=2975984 RepID=UPI002E376980|nr:FAD:protein FMN transferase [Micromonospora sp. NBC_01699]